MPLIAFGVVHPPDDKHALGPDLPDELAIIWIRRSNPSGRQAHDRFGRGTALRVVRQQTQWTADYDANVGVGAGYAIGRISRVRDPKRRLPESSQPTRIQCGVPGLDIVNEDEIRPPNDPGKGLLHTGNPHVIERQPVDAPGHLGAENARREPQTLAG